MSLDRDRARRLRRRIREIESRGGTEQGWRDSGLPFHAYIATLEPAERRKPLPFDRMVDGVLASVAIGGGRRDPAGEAAEAQRQVGDFKIDTDGEGRPRASIKGATYSEPGAPVDLDYGADPEDDPEYEPIRAGGKW